MLSHHNYEWADIYFREDDIVEVHLKPLRYNGEMVSWVVEKIVELSGKSNMVVLIITNPHSRVALTGFTTVFSEDSVNYSVAKAYVFHNNVQFFLARLGRLIFRPRRPIRFFNNRVKAETWLKSFMGYGM
jgi:hypothetical protein